MTTSSRPNRNRAARTLSAGAAALIVAATLGACAADGTTDAEDPTGTSATTATTTDTATTNNNGQPGNGADAGEEASESEAAPGDVDQQTLNDISYSFEEERMARDLYTALDEAWGTRQFAQIAEAEQRHMDALTGQMDRLGMMRAAVVPEPGVYTIDEIQALYDGWLGRGLTSEREALVVGIELEERDIADLEDIIARTEDPELVETYEYLLSGARNHLEAFQTGLESLDGRGSGRGGGGAPGRN